MVQIQYKWTHLSAAGGEVANNFVLVPLPSYTGVIPPKNLITSNEYNYTSTNYDPKVLSNNFMIINNL